MLRKAGATLERVDFFRVPTNRSWVRDYGPIFVKRGDGEIAIANWKFNGWAKYHNYQLDDRVVDRLARALKARQSKPAIRVGKREQRIVLEGGSIDVNGAGALLTTEECLLSPIQARNPGLTRQELEQVFAEYLGIRNTIWLKNGIAGDDTHGHVDDLARFADRQTIVLAVEQEKGDANYEPTHENLKLLKAR